MEHPCLACGACCAAYRVEFSWIETVAGGSPWQVPASHFEVLTAEKRIMKGTNEKRRPSCIALKGRIGREASCSIYENRPTPCRKFQASFEDGKHNPRCDHARSLHGLRPLKPSDFPNHQTPLEVAGA